MEILAQNLTNENWEITFQIKNYYFLKEINQWVVFFYHKIKVCNISAEEL